MPQYEYKAMDEAGRVMSGNMIAQDETALADMLGAQGLFLTETKRLEIKELIAPAPTRSAVQFAGKAKLDHLSVFNEQLTIMVRTSLPILESLSTLARQQKSPEFKAALADVARCVRGGQSLAVSFARHPGIFDDVYVSLVSAGEAAGKLPEVLERLGEYIRFRIRIRDKAISTLIYPSIVVSASVTAILFLVVFILPTFMQIFAEFHMRLPLSTRILLWISAFVRAWWHALLIFMAAASYAAWKALTKPAHSRLVMGIVMGVPVVGEVVRNLAMTRVFRTLASLTSSGVPILKSIELAKASAGNQIFADALDRVYRSASEGHGLADPMSSSPFPDIVGGMINTGEKTGALSDVLIKLADFYELQTANSIQRFFDVLEPLFVIVLGLMVGGIAFSVLIPVFSLSQGF